MRAATLKALVWKDFRISRRLLFFGTLIWAIPYLICLASAAGDGENFSQAVQESILEGSRISFMLSFLLIAFLVGNVTTTEYSNRSASFLAYLSPSNAAILTSKTICLAVLCTVLPLTSFILAYAASGSAPFNAGSEVSTSLAFWVLIFGAAWLGGLVTRSAGGALLCAIITPIAVVWIAIKLRGDGSEEMVRQWLFTAALSVGLGCFALGWLYGLRRGRASS